MENTNGTTGTPAPPPPPASPPPTSPLPPAPSGPEGKVSENRTIMVVLAYFGILALIPLLVEKEDREVQWHAKHGLVLLVAEVVLFVVLQIGIMVVGAISHGLGCILGLIFPLVALGLLVLHILCMVKGVKGERFLIPGISEFADRF